MEEETKIWLDEDGILRFKLGNMMNEETLKMLNTKFIEFGTKASGKIKVIIDLSKITYKSTINLRKNAIRILKDTLKDPGYDKVAFFGGNMLSRTVVSFIITASTFKNIKIFKTEEDALKWLKEE